MRIIINGRTLIAIATVACISLSGIESASADESQQKRTTQASVEEGLTNDFSESSRDGSRDISRSNTQIYQPAQSPKAGTVVAATSVVDILKWVCKTTLTVVGIGAWVTTVYSSGGVLFTVSTWVVRYVTIPVLACNWL